MNRLLEYIPAESYPLYSSLRKPFTRVSSMYLRVLGAPKFRYANIPKIHKNIIIMYNCSIHTVCSVTHENILIMYNCSIHTVCSV